MPAKNVKVKFGYCDYCEKEIEKPVKRPLDELQKTLVVIVLISTLGVAVIITGVMIISMNLMAILTSIITVGIGIVIWAIYTKIIRKAVFCPECESKLKFSKEAFDTTQTIEMTLEPSTPKEAVLEKIEEKKESGEKPPDITPEEEKETQFCSFCGHELSIEYVTCPYCQTALKF